MIYLLPIFANGFFTGAFVLCALLLPKGWTTLPLIVICQQMGRPITGSWWDRRSKRSAVLIGLATGLPLILISIVAAGGWLPGQMTSLIVFDVVAVAISIASPLFYLAGPAHIIHTRASEKTNIIRAKGTFCCGLLAAFLLETFEWKALLLAFGLYVASLFLLVTLETGDTKEPAAPDPQPGL